MEVVVTTGAIRRANCQSGLVDKNMQAATKDLRHSPNCKSTNKTDHYSAAVKTFQGSAFARLTLQVLQLCHY